MAELSGHWTTTAGGTGHQQTSYTQAQLSTAYKVIAGAAGYEGVCPGLGNMLICAANGANTVSVGTGGAMVDGKWYYNDASLDVNIPSAVGAGNTRIDRIVLRANWAGYEVAVTRIAGTDAASPVAPAITQTSGTTYDIMLCRVLVTTAGAVTVTDERVWAYPYSANGLAVLGRAASSAGTVAPIYPAGDGLALRRSGTSLSFGQLSGLGIANDAIDSQHYAAGSIDGEHIANDAVDSQHYAAGSIDGEHIANDAIDSRHYAAGSIDLEHMSANSVDSDQYVDGSIDLVHLSANCVDDTKVGNRVPQFYRRVGGSATDWSAQGATTYTPTSVRMQAGAWQLTVPIGSLGSYSALVGFATPFSDKPLVFISLADGTLMTFIKDWYVTDVAADGFKISLHHTEGSNGTLTVNWLAIGPE